MLGKQLTQIKMQMNPSWTAIKNPHSETQTRLPTRRQTMQPKDVGD